MKCKKYIILLVSVAFTLFFAGCESDFVDPLISPSIEIKRVPSMSQSEITIVFAPSRTVSQFEYAIGDESDEESFLNGTYSGIVKVEDGDTHEVKFPGLTQNSVYTIFARAYSANGTPGPLASIKEKTRKPSTEINVQVEYEAINSVAVTITADVSYNKYEYALGLEGDLANFENGSLSGIKTSEEISKYTANFFNLQPATDYIFYIKAYDRTSKLATKTLEFPVRTANRGAVPAVECKINHIDLYKGEYLFTPNEHVGKVAAAFTLNGELDDVINNEIYWKGNMINMLESWAQANQQLVSEGYDEPFTAEYTTPKMLLGEYDPYKYPIEVFVLVYDKNEKPFAVQRFVFYTPEYNSNAKEARAELKISNITQNGALYEFTPNEHAIGMFFETFDADWVHETMQADYYYEGFLERYVSYYGYWSYFYKTIVSTFPERNAEPGKKYYVFYMAINGNGTDGYGPLNYLVYETLPADDKK